MSRNIAVMVKEHPLRIPASAITFGPAALYRLSTPLAFDAERPSCSYVFVSSSVVMGEPETYAFAADETGDCLSWRELSGSAKGEFSHSDVLANMGYLLVEPCKTHSDCEDSVDLGLACAMAAVQS